MRKRKAENGEAAPEKEKPFPEVGKELNAALGRAGLNVMELANLTGIPHQTIRSWLEGDHMLPANKLDRVREALGDPTLLASETFQRFFENRVLDSMVNIIDYFLDGMHPDRAAEREVGRGKVTPEMRVRLARGDEPALRQRISDIAPHWEHLDEEGRRAVVRYMLELLEASKRKDGAK